MIKLRDPNDMTKENRNSFWTIFMQWMSTKQVREEYFSEEYNNATTEHFYDNIKFFDTQYILYYSKKYPFLKIANDGIGEEQLKDFLNITYNKWVVDEKR